MYPSVESVAKYDKLRSLVARWIDRQKELGLPSGSSLPASTITSHASSASTLNTTDVQPVKKRVGNLMPVEILLPQMLAPVTFLYTQNIQLCHLL